MADERARVLRGVVAVLGVLALAVQLVVLPRTAAAAAARYPEVAHLEAPYLLATVLAVLALEIALVAAWMAAPGASAGAARWIDVGAVGLVVSALLLVLVLAHAGFVENVGGPPVPIGIVLLLGLAAAVPPLRRAALAHLAGTGASARA
ncbi:hypothetical protein [Cellulomonas oligotrophica]|uniref:Uncharacterized protein n=1 Tax=Cellulomonas oligotrophica TaxID=931536 RepID=A0A7Y9JYS5_9CELL|nr:hypothetical protein [Cellulomonas oligotrophica]NYD87107.1 hypothetical protein [Cellulomonas oligotrophica]GIG32107.1 hypothetical protein Col01nite_12660 [Cellulomonas oligotrophica]